MNDKVIKTKIREYCEDMEVEIVFLEDTQRWVVRAYNEAGFNHVNVDLEDILSTAQEYIKNIA